MDTEPTLVPQDETQEKYLKMLGDARGFLYDDDFVRRETQKLLEKTSPEHRPSVESMIDKVTGIMDGNSRAYNAFGNLIRHLPGTDSYDPDSEFGRNFEEAAMKTGISTPAIERMCKNEPNEWLKIYRYVFPVIEIMVAKGQYDFSY